MHSIYFTEEHQLFRASFRDFFSVPREEKKLISSRGRWFRRSNCAKKNPENWLPSVGKHLFIPALQIPWSFFFFFFPVELRSLDCCTPTHGKCFFSLVLVGRKNIFFLPREKKIKKTPGICKAGIKKLYYFIILFCPAAAAVQQQQQQQRPGAAPAR